MKRILNRYAPAPTTVEVAQPSVTKQEALASLNKMRMNMESSVSLHNGLSSTLGHMRSNPSNFRGSRVKAYDLLRTVAAKRVGKDVGRIDLESFGISGFVSDAVKTNLESGEELMEQVEDSVQPDVGIADQINELFLNSISTLKTAEAAFNESLQQARDGVEGEYVTGIEGFRVDSFMSGEGSEPESAAGKALATSLAARKEAGDTITFDCDKETGSVVVVSQSGTVINSDVSNFPFTFYGAVRAKLLADAGDNTEAEEILRIVKLGHSVEDLRKAAEDVYLNSTFASHFKMDANFQPIPDGKKVLVKSYSTNEYAGMVTVAEEARTLVAADLKVLCALKDSASPEVDNVAVTTYCAFVAALAAILS